MSILQFELWLDCPNNCTFCAIREFKSQRFNKLDLIHTALEKLDEIDFKDYDDFVLIGGELITEEIEGKIKEDFLVLINKVINILKEDKIKKFYLVSSFLNKNSVIKEILELFKTNGLLNRLGMNTSWDYQYRFNDKNKDIWNDNISLIKSYGCELHYETILTDSLIGAVLDNEPEAINYITKENLDLIRPSGSYTKSNKNLKGFFPTRSNFFKFLTKIKKLNYKLYESIFDLKKRAATIYTIPFNCITHRLNSLYIEELNDELNICGHDKLYSECYADSDKCIICDILHFKENCENE
jgi:hypothetical protein